MKLSVAERFFDKISTDDITGCWLWIANTNNRGYGVFKYTPSITLAHRFSFMIHKGPIPDGMVIMHLCDNPRCVNPVHLKLGTQADNRRDMISKNRHAWLNGENHPNTKLTFDDVDYIHLLLERGFTQQSIADKFGVSDASISNIKTGKTWSKRK